MSKQSPSLLWNEDPDHAGVIAQELETARDFICVVAFAKSTGFSRLQKTLKSRLDAGMKATFVIGTHFFQSDPDLLDDLLALRPRKNVSVFMGDFETGKLPTFHPKLYLFCQGRRTTLIVGSANLTGGGLANNNELSVRLSGQHQNLGDEIREWIDTVLKRKEIVPATTALVDRYRHAFDINKVEQALARKRLKRALAEPEGGLLALRHALADLRADPTETGFDALVAKRRSDRDEGFELLKLLAAPGEITGVEFESLYGRLIKTMHSGGLNRGKTRIARNYSAFRNAVRSLLETSGHAKKMFDHFYLRVANVERAGTNVITEVLHLVDNESHAVMNQNSVSGLSLCGYAGYPKEPNRTNVDGELYARFCEEANEVRAALGLENLSQLDTVFNYLYWQNKS